MLEEKLAEFFKGHVMLAQSHLMEPIRAAFFEGAAAMAEIMAAAEKRPLHFNVTVHGAAPVSAGSGQSSGGGGGLKFPPPITTVQS